MWGSNDAALQGYFDLSDMPLPPGMTTANYQVTFEAINPLYMLSESVGPYVDGSPTPSGTLPADHGPSTVRGLAQTLTVNIADSAAGGYQDAIATEASPRMLPPSGHVVRPPQPGGPDRLVHLSRSAPDRTFTVVTQALDETGVPTETKALPAHRRLGRFRRRRLAPSVGSAPGLNGWATGETWLRVASTADDVVRLGIADMRGDGRPDYAYNGWVLYADTVAARSASRFRRPHRDSRHGLSPFRHGARRRPARLVTSISPNEITAIAPPPPPASPARSMSRSTTCPSSTPPPSSPAASATTPAPATALTLITAPVEYRAHRRADSLHRHRVRTQPGRRQAASPSPTPSPAAPPPSAADSPSAPSPPPATAAPP